MEYFKKYPLNILKKIPSIFRTLLQKNIPHINITVSEIELYNIPKNSQKNFENYKFVTFKNIPNDVNSLSHKIFLNMAKKQFQNIPKNYAHNIPKMEYF